MSAASSIHSVEPTPKQATVSTTPAPVREGPLSPLDHHFVHSYTDPKKPHGHGSVELDEYFVGPRDLDRHSKLPYFMRLHGSVLPKLIVPLIFVGGWSTCITVISDRVYPLAISSLLLTVLGFVVGLSLSFRSSTAYERYAEGRKYWAQLSLTSRNLSRLLWIHTQERHADDPELGKADLLAKLTALNLIVAFAVALKHKLRFEPAADYPDIEPFVSHLRTFARAASDPTAPPAKKKTPWKAAGEYLGVSFAESNPRKLIKRSEKNLGNLPLEILNYLSVYMETVISNGTMKAPIHQTHAMNHLTTLTEILTGTERVLTTPLPLAYSIAISQITWIYVLALPFQLLGSLSWVTIPGTMVAAYIILGLALIGREIENPFGHDVNDLPLDAYCTQIQAEMDIVTSMEPPKTGDWVTNASNLVLYPLSSSEYGWWGSRSTEDIREALRVKARASHVEKPGASESEGSV